MFPPKPLPVPINEFKNVYLPKPLPVEQMYQEKKETLICALTLIQFYIFNKNKN